MPEFTEGLKKMRVPRETTEFNIWMKHCLIKTMGDNRDIGITPSKAMKACAFVHRNRNVPVEPIDTDKRIRMFLTGEIDLTDPKWMSTKKEKEEIKKRLISQMGKKEYEKWISSL